MFIVSRAMRMRARVLDTILAVCLCVGAGVLLSTVFIHMIPETRESLDAAANLGYLPGQQDMPLKSAGRSEMGERILQHPTISYRALSASPRVRRR